MTLDDLLIDFPAAPLCSVESGRRTDSRKPGRSSRLQATPHLSGKPTHLYTTHKHIDNIYRYIIYIITCVSLVSLPEGRCPPPHRGAPRRPLWGAAASPTANRSPRTRKRRRRRRRRPARRHRAPPRTAEPWRRPPRAGRRPGRETAPSPPARPTRWVTSCHFLLLPVMFCHFLSHPVTSYQFLSLPVHTKGKWLESRPSGSCHVYYIMCFIFIICYVAWWPLYNFLVLISINWSWWRYLNRLYFFGKVK